MAKVNVRLFGVLRIDTHLKSEEIDVDRVIDIFDSLNKRVDEVYEENKKKQPGLVHPELLSYKDALVFINGDRCAKAKQPLKDGDEIWLLSPASGG